MIAIQRIREQIPDIIFADLMLPVMDGFTLISKLRERRETAKIPVVLVTALNAHDTEARTISGSSWPQRRKPARKKCNEIADNGYEGFNLDSGSRGKAALAT